MELEDLSCHLSEINRLANIINAEIQEHDALVADIPAQKQKCSDIIWAKLAYNCRHIIAAYREKQRASGSRQKSLEDEKVRLIQEFERLESEIADLNRQTVNTTKVMQDINNSLRNAGFSGFFLREKPDARYVYQLVRDRNGTPEVVEENLSEGERHFIAFLYFYHTVMGSQSEMGIPEEKIVVIDDPVSSMDSSTLFVVASLTREMISVCYNNYSLQEGNTDNHIRQFFCMTHNPYFFREISYNRLSDYECAVFFEIKKDASNNSSVTPCIDYDAFDGHAVNASPVRNSYDALWYEYATAVNPATLMIAIRQILEYYFVQLLGYPGANLRKELLDKHESQFIHILEDGSRDKSDYRAAASMIAMIDAGTYGFNDGLYYDASAADINQLRKVFEKIFEIMNQHQHFAMMTRQR